MRFDVALFHKTSGVTSFRHVHLQPKQLCFFYVYIFDQNYVFSTNRDKKKNMNIHSFDLKKFQMMSEWCSTRSLPWLDTCFFLITTKKGREVNSNPRRKNVAEDADPGPRTCARRKNKLVTTTQNSQATYRRIIFGTKLEYNTKLSWRILFWYDITKYNKKKNGQRWRRTRDLPTARKWSYQLS